MIWNFTGHGPLPVRDYVVSTSEWPYVVESQVESFATPCVAELDR